MAGICQNSYVIKIVLLKKVKKLRLLKLRMWSTDHVNSSQLQFSTLVELQPENVCLWSVYRHFSRTTAVRILANLGQKLEGDKWGTVTGPDFPRKLYLINYSWKHAEKWPFLTLSRFWRKSSAGLVIFNCWIWKFGLSVNSRRKPHVWEKYGWFLRKFFVRHVGCRSPPGVEFAIFSSLVHPVNLILHI